MLKVRDLGERRVIEKIIENLHKPPKMKVPFGDDVAAVPLGRNRLAVLKTDMLVGETDIPPGMTLQQAARKAVVMNVSDFAAKGVKPLAFLASLGLPATTTEEEVEEIGKGLNDGVREYGTYLVGGDTGEAPCLIISCMGFGITTERRFIPRYGARVGDLLAVTGPFGRTSAGLKHLLEGHSIYAAESNLLNAVYLPKARLDQGVALGRTGTVSASIDSSDGLAVCLHQLREMSHVGFTVTTVPISSDVVTFAERNGLDATELALHGGEEYELVLTIPPSGWEKALRAVRKTGGDLKAIGITTKNPEIILSLNGVENEIPYRGWEHFKRSKE